MKSCGICLVVLLGGTVSAYASAIDVPLGIADSFALLAGSTMTNTGPSSVHGNLGVSPGSALTGFPPGIITPPGILHAADAVAAQAQKDLTTAYNFAASEACNTGLTGQNLGGLTLTPGVYCFASSAQLTGTLTLNAQGDPNAVFLFQLGSTLTTATSSSVVFTNGGQGDNTYWQVGSSATLGTTTAFAGNILAFQDITLNTGATITCGRALASNGAVTMDSNTISIDTPGCESTAASTTPEPGTATLIGVGPLLSLVLFRWRSRKHAA